MRGNCRIVHTLRTRSGIGLARPESFHDGSVSDATRARGASVRTTTSVARKIQSEKTLASMPVTFCWKTTSTIPSAIPTGIVSQRIRMRAIMATSSAFTRSGYPSVSCAVPLAAPSGVTNCTAASTMIVVAVNAAEMPQTNVDVRATEIPTSRALSGFEAAALTISPSRVRVMNHASSTTRIGTAISTLISRAPTNRSSVTCQVQSLGTMVGKSPPGGTSGRSSAKTSTRKPRS